MKKITLFLFLLANIAFAQLPCTIPNVSSITGASNQRFMMCDNGVSKYASLFQILDTTKFPRYLHGFPTGFGYFDGVQWKSATSGNLVALLGYTPTPNTRSINSGFGLIGGGNLTSDRTISIDTNKVPYPNSLAVNGFLKRVDRKWVYDSTAYIPFSGTDSITGNLNAIVQDFQVGRTTDATNGQSNIFFHSDPTDASVSIVAGTPFNFVSQVQLETTTSSSVCNLQVYDVLNLSTSRRILGLSAGGAFLFTGQDAQYAADYSSFYTSRSFPDKNYVDTHLSGKVLAVPSSGQNGQSIRWNNSTPGWEYFTAGTGSGTVSSVGLSMPSIYSTAGSPVTSTGTFTVTLANQVATSIWGNFTSGSTTPSFNAATADGQFLVRRSGALTFGTIVSGDIPTLNQSTTGSAATLTTGRTIGQNGDVVWTSPSFDGSSNVTAAATIQPNAITTSKILDDAVTLPKIANMGAKRILGNPSNTSSSPVEIHPDSSMCIDPDGTLHTNLTPIVISGTSYTLLDSNATKAHVFTSSSNVTVTLGGVSRKNASTLFYKQGTGNIIFTFASPITAIEAANNIDTIVTRYGWASAYLRTSTIWSLTGMLGTSTSGGGGGTGTTTNPVTFNNSGSGASSGTTFNGAAAVTVSYNTVGASPATSGTTILKGNGSGGTSSAIPGTDYSKLNWIARKTSNYTANANEGVPVGLEGGNVTITLPTAPVDGTIIGVKVDSTVTGNTNTLTVQRGGSDKINLTGTTITYILKAEGGRLNYRSSNSTWYVEANDFPRGQADIRYQSAFASSVPNQAILTPLSSYSGNGVPGLRQIDNFDLQDNNRRKIPISDFDVFGNSIAVGQNASPLSESYVNKVSAYNQVTATNYALGGRGAFYAALACITNKNAFDNIGATMAEFGLNDVRRSTNTTVAPAATLNKIESAIKVLFVNTNMKSCVAASAITNTGTWSNWTTLTTKSSAKLSGNARQSSTSGNTLSYTTLVASSSVVIGTIGTDGTVADYGRFTVTVDGTVVATYTPNGRTDGVLDGTDGNTLQHDAVIINNLRNATHAITITLLDSKTTVIDYIGTLMEPNYAQSFFFIGIPHLDATGYAASPANATTTIVDNTNTSIYAMMATICKNYPWVFVDINRNYDVTTGLDVADHIHPNNLGHTQWAIEIQKSIANGTLYAGMPIKFTTNTGGTIMSGYYSRYLGRTRISANIHPVSAIIGNTANYAGILDVYTNTSDAGIEVATSTTAGGATSSKMTVNSLGQLAIYGSTSASINVRQTQATQEGIALMPQGATNGIGFNLNFVSPNYIALNANTGLIRGVNGGFIFYGNTGQGVGGTVTVQQIATMDANRNFILHPSGGATTAPTSMQGGLAMSNGTAPTSNVSTGFSLYSANRGATAGKAGLNVRSEDGTLHVMSDLVGHGTTSPTANLQITQAALSTGWNPAFRVVQGAHTSLTASTEFTDIVLGTTRTISQNSGAIATQRYGRYEAPTHNFASASTITDAVGFEFVAPIAGTNATFTNNWALKSTGNLWVTGNMGLGTSSPVATFHNNGSSAFASTVTSAGTLTYNKTFTQVVFTGSTTTHTLPAISGNTGLYYYGYNRGSGMLTLTLAGTNIYYNAQNVGSVAVPAGYYYYLYNDGTYWLCTISNGLPNLPLTGGTLSGNLGFSGTNGIIGTSTNNNATSGNVGESQTSFVSSGSAISLTTATTSTITGINLPVGDWTCSGNINYVSTVATVSGKVSGLSTSNITMPSDGSEVYNGSQMTLITTTDGTTLARKRFSLSTTTTVYLLGQATFSAGTMAAYGYLGCIRER